MFLVINDMIEQNKGRKREILLELKRLNLEAYQLMRSNYRRYKEKYTMLQQTDMWKEARKLLVEYFTYDNMLICQECGQVVDYRQASMHHKQYKIEECFTPQFITFLHKGCHRKDM